MTTKLLTRLIEALKKQWQRATTLPPPKDVWVHERRCLHADCQQKWRRLRALKPLLLHVDGAAKRWEKGGEGRETSVFAFLMMNRVHLAMSVGPQDSLEVHVPDFIAELVRPIAHLVSPLGFEDVVGEKRRTYRFMARKGGTKYAPLLCIEVGWGASEVCRLVKTGEMVTKEVLLKQEVEETVVVCGGDAT